MMRRATRRGLEPCGTSIRGCRRRDGRRRILVDARTPVNFTHGRAGLSRVCGPTRVSSSTSPPAKNRSGWPRSTARRGDAPLITPVRAALMKFDAYVASDFMWAALPRGHAASRCSTASAASTASTRRQVDARLAPAVLRQRAAAAQLRRGRRDRSRQPGDPARSACRRSTASWTAPAARRGAADARPRSGAADGALRADLVAGLVARTRWAWTWSRAPAAMPVNVIVKLHDRSRDLRERYSGGVDWVAALQPLMQRRRRASIAPGHDICAVPRRRRPDDHRPQLRRVRVPAAGSPARADPPARADRSWPTSIPTTSELLGVGVGLDADARGDARSRRDGARRSTRPQRHEREPSPRICSTSRAAPRRGPIGGLVRSHRPRRRARWRHRSGGRMPARQRDHAGVQRRAVHRRRRSSPLSRRRSTTSRS